MDADSEAEAFAPASSWPMDAARRTLQPPKIAPQKPPCPTWEVPPLELPLSPHLSRSGSETTVGEDLYPHMSSEEEMLVENGAVHIRLVGLDDVDLEAPMDAPAMETGVSPRSSGTPPAGTSPLLRAALAQVAAESKFTSEGRPRFASEPSPLPWLEVSGRERAESDGAVCSPSRSFLPPPSPPLKPAAAPCEDVRPLELPASPKLLSPVTSPRPAPYRIVTPASPGKVGPGSIEHSDVNLEDDPWMFTLDEAAIQDSYDTPDFTIGFEADEPDEDSFSRRAFHLIGLDCPEAPRAVEEAAKAGAGPPSPLLMSALAQVAMDTRRGKVD